MGCPRCFSHLKSLMLLYCLNQFVTEHSRTLLQRGDMLEFVQSLSLNVSPQESPHGRVMNIRLWCIALGNVMCVVTTCCLGRAASLGSHAP